MPKEIHEYVNALLQKSEEGYLMALEIVNKPTLKYRTEGFCFFICNAWEFLLKAFIIISSDDINSINYKDKTARTIGLSDCIEKVFTSTTDKVKTNLNHVVTIRNRSTHLILPDYDYEFAPLFQQNLTYFNRFFSNKFPDYNFNMAINPFISITKSPKQETSPLMIIDDTKYFMEEIVKMCSIDGIGQHIQFYVTKKASDADISVRVDPDSPNNIRMVKVPKDVNKLYPYTYKDAIKSIQESLELHFGQDHGFTTRSFDLISKDHPIKTDEKYCYIFDYSGGVRKFSQEVVDFVVYKYCNDEEFKEKYKKKG